MAVQNICYDQIPLQTYKPRQLCTILVNSPVRVSMLVLARRTYWQLVARVIIFPVHTLLAAPRTVIEYGVQILGSNMYLS